VINRDSKFNFEVAAAVRSLGVNSVRTSFESPWQNGIAERWVESCRHDLLDHVKPQTPESATLRLTQLGRATTRRGILLLHSFLSVFRRARVEVQACCERMRLINFSAGWTFGKAQAPKSGFRRTWKPMRWTMTGP